MPSEGTTYRKFREIPKEELPNDNEEIVHKESIKMSELQVEVKLTNSEVAKKMETVKALSKFAGFTSEKIGVPKEKGKIQN